MALYTTQYFSAKGMYFSLDLAQPSKTILLHRYARWKDGFHYNIFLSPGFLDAQILLGLAKELEDQGLSIYIDWIEDQLLDRSQVTTTTAEVIRNRMRGCDSLIYVWSENVGNSKWIQWQLGYFEAYNGHVAILPIVSSNKEEEEFNGVEFVGLYPYIDRDGVTNDTTRTLRVGLTRFKRTNLKDWYSSTKIGTKPGPSRWIKPR